MGGVTRGLEAKQVGVSPAQDSLDEKLAQGADDRTLTDREPLPAEISGHEIIEVAALIIHHVVVGDPVAAGTLGGIELVADHQMADSLKKQQCGLRPISSRIP